VGHLDDGEAQAVMRSMVLGLTPTEVAACAYHEPDWQRAADTAVALVERTGELTFQDLDEAGRSTDDKTRWAFYSLKFDPIIWHGGDGLVNGQHRVCAMKLAGVSRCPIVGFRRYVARHEEGERDLQLFLAADSSLPSNRCGASGKRG
jgi:hypothetical protein